MKQDPQDQYIQKEILAIDSRLAELEFEKRRLLDLKQRLLYRISPNTLPPNQKVNLFQQFFKGRTDAFSIRWTNNQGRSGYALACHNEWLPGFVISQR